MIFGKIKVKCPHDYGIAIVSVRLLNARISNGLCISRFLHDFSGLACWEAEKVSNSKVRGINIIIVKIWWKYEKWCMKVGICTA